MMYNLHNNNYIFFIYITATKANGFSFMLLFTQTPQPNKTHKNIFFKNIQNKPFRMEAAKTYAYRLFNYKFKNKNNKVKTANIITAYEKTLGKFKSNYDSLTLWTNMLKNYFTYFIKNTYNKLKLNKYELFNKNKILKLYQASFNNLIYKLFKLIDTTQISTDNSTNFKIIKSLINIYDKFLAEIKLTQKIFLDLYSEPLQTRTQEFKTYGYEVMYEPPIKKEIKLKYKPYKKFSKYLNYRKAIRGIHF